MSMDRTALIAALEANTAAKKLKPVTVPGLGEVFIRPATIGDTEEEISNQGAGKAHVLSRRVARMLCDDKGAPLLDANNPEDVLLLAGQPESVLTRLSKAAADLDGTSEEGFEAMGKG